VQTWSNKKVVLKNLEIKGELFDKFKLPLKLVVSNIGKITFDFSKEKCQLKLD
jgi:hypothetical protein